jgi:ribosomal protein S18 acetylase RimI-like enzyme
MYTVLLNRQNQNAFLHLIEPALTGALQDSDVVALGAVEEDGTAVGVMICRMRDDWVDIVWLYADPRFPSRGIGQLLVDQLVSSAIEEPGIVGIFADYENIPENFLLTRLFAQNTFRIEDIRKAIFEISLADVAQNAFWSKDMDDACVLSLESADDAQWKSFQVELRNNEQPVAASLPIDRQAYHPRLSSVYTSEGKIRGVLLVSCEAKALELSYAHVLPGNGKALGLMLHKVGRLAMSEYPPSTLIHFTPVDEAGEKIAEKLFPELKMRPFHRAVLWTAGAARGAPANRSGS